MEKNKSAVPAGGTDNERNTRIYNELREVPSNALKPITDEHNATAFVRINLFVNHPDTGEMTTIARFKSVNETVLDEDRLRDEEPEECAKYMRRFFDKKLFKEEDKDRFKRYSTNRKGARRFSVQAV